MAKKKSNPQTDDNKSPKTENQINNQQAMDDASEKLDSLKSLNSMLLKETVERRQQVDSLIKSNESLESELNRSKSDNDSLTSQLNMLTEQAMMFEVEKDFVYAFVSLLVNEMGEVNGRERDEFCSERDLMAEKIDDLEKEMARVLKEKSDVEEERGKNEAEIGSLNSRLNTLVDEIGKGKVVFSRVCDERDNIKAQLDAQVLDADVLRLKVTEAEKREAEILDKVRKVKGDYDKVVHDNILNEKRIESMLMEKDLVDKSLVESNGTVDELKRDIEKMVKEKVAIEEEKNGGERKINELQNMVRELQKLIEKMKMEEEGLLEKVADLEKKCVGSSKKEAEMGIEIDGLVQEMKKIEEIVKRLNDEKSLVMKDLEAALKTLECQKLRIEEISEEKMKIENAKIQGENDIAMLKEQLRELKDTILLLENSSICQVDKIKQLEAEVSHYKAALDSATVERNVARECYNEEKNTGNNLREKILKMEKDTEAVHEDLVKMKVEYVKVSREKSELENRCAAMYKDIAMVEKKLCYTQKEVDDIKGKLGQSEAKSKKILKILKNTSLICQSNEANMVINQENNSGEELKPHVTELEAIKIAFMDRENKVEDMKKQLELLNISMVKANKGKSFWTLVSSATTVLAAAVSFAYVARGH